MIHGIMSYDPVAAYHLVSKANSLEDLSRVLQILANSLGYQEAAFLTRTGTQLANVQLASCVLDMGSFATFFQSANNHNPTAPPTTTAPSTLHPSTSASLNLTQSVKLSVELSSDLSLASCRDTYKRLKQRCWEQTIWLAERSSANLSEQSNKHLNLCSLKTQEKNQATEIARIVHACFYENVIQMGVVLMLCPLGKPDKESAGTEGAANTLIEHTPALLHIQQMITDKVNLLIQYRFVADVSDQNWYAGVNPLSLREREVLRLTADGKTAEEIAEILGITARTVNFHMMQIMRILFVPNKTAAVAKVLINGWAF